MNIVKDFRNDLLKRKEVLFSVKANSNPGIAKMQQDCAHHFKTELDNVVIKGLRNNFGTKEFSVEAFVYDSVQDKIGIEPKKKIKGEKK
ncbi:MAG: hypothetical protein AABX83_02240 [Nanoarchaeota archaeon]